jgi:hypothetical protein
MSEYEKVLYENGYDDVNFLLEHGLDNKELKSIGVAKSGHRMKLCALYKLKIEGSDSSSSEEEESVSGEESESEEGSGSEEESD